MKKYFFLMLALPLLFSACKKDEPSSLSGTTWKRVATTPATGSALAYTETNIATFPDGTNFTWSNKVEESDGNVISNNSTSGTYTFDGKTVVLTANGKTTTGTVSGNTMTFEDGSNTLVLTKQ